VEERNEAKIKMLNRRTRIDTENYKNKRKQAKKMRRTKEKKSHDLKVMDGKRKQVKEMKQESSTQ
jgi:hypothetical protein